MKTLWLDQNVIEIQFFVYQLFEYEYTNICMASAAIFFSPDGAPNIGQSCQAPGLESAHAGQTSAGT
jgi:hypothetical protein